MIDYVKILFQNIDATRLYNLTFLDFKKVVSTKSGELSTKEIANFHYCKIIIYDSGSVYFTGSIHKFWNSLHNVLAPNCNEKKAYKGYNGNLFALKDVLEVRTYLTKLFDCEPHELIFQNIEFGINTIPSFNPQLFITGLLYQNNKLFEFKYDRYFAQSIHQRYILKIYNKSNQYGMLENTLRIELKVLRIEDIKLTGIKSFNDINSKTLLKAKNVLLKRFKEVVYFDNTIDKNKLTKPQKRTLLKYKNQRFWIDDLIPKNRDFHKKKLLRFTSDFSENLHQQLVKNINEKIVIINRLSERDKIVIINTSNIELNITNKPPENKGKKCKVTGVDISMQKEGSILVSHRGLKHYFKTDKKLFENIKNKYLSKNWIDADFQTQIKELAHNIRNKSNNRKLMLNRKYNNNQTQLFESIF